MGDILMFNKRFKMKGEQEHGTYERNLEVSTFK